MHSVQPGRLLPARPEAVSVNTRSGMMPALNDLVGDAVAVELKVAMRLVIRAVYDRVSDRCSQASGLQIARVLCARMLLPIRWCRMASAHCHGRVHTLG
jgi:hypothetical protein